MAHGLGVRTSAAQLLCPNHNPTPQCEGTYDAQQGTQVQALGVQEQLRSRQPTARLRDFCRTARLGFGMWGVRMRGNAISRHAPRTASAPC